MATSFEGLAPFAKMCLDQNGNTGIKQKITDLSVAVSGNGDPLFREQEHYFLLIFFSPTDDPSVIVEYLRNSGLLFKLETSFEQLATFAKQCVIKKEIKVEIIDPDVPPQFPFEGKQELDDDECMGINDFDGICPPSGSPIEDPMDFGNLAETGHLKGETEPQRRKSGRIPKPKKFFGKDFGFGEELIGRDTEGRGKKRQKEEKGKVPKRKKLGQEEADAISNEVKQNRKRADQKQGDLPPDEDFDGSLDESGLFGEDSQNRVDDQTKEGTIDATKRDDSGETPLVEESAKRRSYRLMKAVEYRTEEESDEEESSEESGEESSGSEEEWVENRRRKRSSVIEDQKEKDDEVLDQPVDYHMSVTEGDGTGAVDEGQKYEEIEEEEGGKEMDQTADGDNSRTPKDSEKQCPVNGCPQKLPSDEALAEHMKISHAKPYLCRVCQKPWQKPRELRRHYRSHTGEKPFECGTCRKAFSTANTTKHNRIHTGARPFACSLCSLRFSDPSNLKRHLLVHTGGKHKCSICGTSFTHNHRLEEHMSVHTGEKKYACKECSFKTAVPPQFPFEGKQELDNDEYMAINGFDGICPLPGSPIEDPMDSGDLAETGHLKGETEPQRRKSSRIPKPKKFFGEDFGFGEKLIGGEEGKKSCRKRSSFAEDEEGKDEIVDHPVDYHMTVTEGDGTGAVEEGQEDEEMEEEEGGEEMDQTAAEDNFQTPKDSEKQCPVDGCNLNLPSDEALVEHMKISHGKAYLCRVCQKPCQSPKDLRKHHRTHSGEKPYSCTFCAYRCAQSGNLKRHLRVHTGEKRHKCSVCGTRERRNSPARSAITRPPTPRT